MTASAEYLLKLADRYDAVAASMRTEADRLTVIAVASQYRQLAAEAKQREAGATPERPR